MWASFNYIHELQITKHQAHLGCHSGDCEEDLIRLRQLPEIRRQLNKIDPESLRKELYEYGTWSDEELSDHDQNLTRILWIVCGDIVDNLNEKQI